MLLDESHIKSLKIEFKLEEEFIAAYQGHQPQWGFEGLSYLTYKRSYARPLDESNPMGPTEEFWQTCKRVVEGTFTKQKQHCARSRLPWLEYKAQLSAQDMFERMWAFKFLPPGRGLWTMGTKIIDLKGSACLQNCGFVSTNNITPETFPEIFGWLMDMSMYGVGVGIDTEGKDQLLICPAVFSPEVYKIEDSKEGWVDSTVILLRGFTELDAPIPQFDYSGIRRAGAAIKTFGGIAPGPEPLIELHQKLIQVLRVNEPTFLTTEMIADVANLIGVCVVSGGIRRTAEILLGRPDDIEFANLKNPEELNKLYRQVGIYKTKIDDYENGRDPNMYFDDPRLSWQITIDKLEKQIQEHPLMTHRWASNNSIFAEVGMNYGKVSVATATNGEPGYNWLENARAYSRMIDPPDHKDYRVCGVNPCVEQSLEHHELCNLVETFPSNHDSFEDYQRTLKMAYLYAKTVTLIPTHNEHTNAVMMRNRRIGCSMSGIAEADEMLGRHELMRWADKGYKYICELDKIYSGWLCIPESIKKTSIKPSGTVSILAGVSPGIHWPHSKFYIRRVRLQATSPLVEACVNAGYHVEKDAYSDNTMVVSFPIESKNFKRSKKDLSIWEQVCNAVDFQAYWADNQVSITVEFKPEEAKDIEYCLRFAERRLKSISFLPKAENSGYVQLPFEEISEEQYKQMASRITELNLHDAIHEVTEKFCDGDKCSIF